MVRVRVLTAALVLLLASASASAEYFKCVHPNGTVTFQDCPCSGCPASAPPTPAVPAPVASDAGKEFLAIFGEGAPAPAAAQPSQRPRSLLAPPAAPVAPAAPKPAAVSDQQFLAMFGYDTAPALAAPPPDQNTGTLGDRVTASVKGWFQGDFCECVFEYMPKVENDVAARVIRDKCRKPAGEYCKSQRGAWFGIKTAPECIEKYAATTHSEFGARLIAWACRKVY